ncbi:MAG TPA: hypothetical protein VF183_12865, partial [Acidimicrobiales bacterium]
MRARHALVRHRAHRVLAVLLLLVATVATVGPAGAAQPDEDDEPDVSVSLVSQSTYVGAGQDFTIRLRVEGARPDDQLKYVIWGAAERAELRAASENPDDIDEEALRDAGLIPIFPRTEPQPYQELVDESGVATLTIPQRTATVTPGVYPLTIHLKRDGDETGPLLTTTLVRVGELDPDAGPLEVALVLPLQADLAHRPDGSVSVHPDERRRLGALVELVERLPTLPVTLVPSPETIDALANGTAADAALLERITAIGAERRVLAGPYVPIDEEALRSAGLDLFIADLYGAGATTLATQLGTTPDPSIALLDPTDTDRTLSLRSQLGAHRLLVDDRALEPLDADDEIAAPLQSFVLHDSTGKPIRAL